MELETYIVKTLCISDTVFLTGISAELFLGVFSFLIDWTSQLGCVLLKEVHRGRGGTV